MLDSTIIDNNPVSGPKLQRMSSLPLILRELCNLGLGDGCAIRKLKYSKTQNVEPKLLFFGMRRIDEATVNVLRNESAIIVEINSLFRETYIGEELYSTIPIFGPRLICTRNTAATLSSKPAHRPKDKPPSTVPELPHTLKQMAQACF